MATDPLVITDEARAMALAVLKGDPVAASALADWVCEQRTREVGRFSVRYMESLEDALRECKRTVMGGIVAEECKVVLERGWAWLSKGKVNQIYALCFGAERTGNEIGRNWWT